MRDATDTARSTCGVDTPPQVTRVRRAVMLTRVKFATRYAVAKRFPSLVVITKVSIAYLGDFIRN